MYKVKVVGLFLWLQVKHLDLREFSVSFHRATVPSALVCFGLQNTDHVIDLFPWREFRGASPRGSPPARR